MEDTNPQATRKRPRLDSGNSSHERMSLSPRDEKSPGRDEDQAVKDASAAVTPSNDTRDTPDPSPSLQRPASRVTINMKSPVTRDGSALPTTHEERPTSGSSAPNTSATEPAETPEQAPGSTREPSEKPAVDSVAPSPTQSVEIEVAAVEDMDQDPSTSQWRSLGEALRAQDQVTGVVEIEDRLPLIVSFPQFGREYEPHESVEEFRKLLEKGGTWFPSIGLLFEICS